ncbi:MAG: phosphoribosyl-AMP cyclohydrolase [Nitrosarchaeum sp.]
MKKSIDEIDFAKSDGLVPVIVQDSITKDVLTLAYSNKESLELTKKTGNSWFWSRSRNKLFHLYDKQVLMALQDK